MATQVTDSFNLARFVEAQQANYAQALAELQAGDKRTHWSWYVLPQMLGLGTSPMSIRFAIRSLEEARAYLAHPVLGSRLRDCVRAMNLHTGLSASAILGLVDARKFHSCLTLFDRASFGESLFQESLRKYFSGEPDPATLALID